MFALHYNYDLSGPGPYAFNRGPWGNHNYHSYAYDHLSKRLIYIKNQTHSFNPDTNDWPHEEHRYGARMTSAWTAASTLSRVGANHK